LTTRAIWCRLLLRWCFIVLSKEMESNTSILISIITNKITNVLTATSSAKRDLSLHKRSKRLWVSPTSWSKKWKRSKKRKLTLTLKMFLIFKQFIQVMMTITIAISISSPNNINPRIKEACNLLLFIVGAMLILLSFQKISLLKRNKIIKAAILSHQRINQAVLVVIEVRGRVIPNAPEDNCLIWVAIEKNLEELYSKKLQVNNQISPQMLMINQ